MGMDLGMLRVEKLIVHDIPKKKDSDQKPTLSEIESPLTQSLKNYFQEKIKGSLASAAYKVIFDPDSSSPVPDLIFDNLGVQDKDFVTMSREIAEHLFASQTNVNPPGLLTLVEASIGRSKALVILKLEKESGVRIEQREHLGKFTFDIERVQDLMFTEKTKVFKVGLFTQDGETHESIIRYAI